MLKQQIHLNKTKKEKVNIFSKEWNSLLFFLFDKVFKFNLSDVYLYMIRTHFTP